MAEIEWGDALRVYDGDEPAIEAIHDSSFCRRSISTCINVVEMNVPIMMDDTPIKFFGVNETGYTGKTLIWPFKDDRRNSKIDYSNRSGGGTVGEWKEDVDIYEVEYEDALNWLRDTALSGRWLGETE